MRRVFVIVLALLAGPAGVMAQGAPQPTAPVVQDTVAAPERGWTALRVTKWSLAAAAGGAALYGYLENRSADERYERLEQTCLVEPDRCEAMLPDGSYADAALEGEYQDIRAMDRRARTALIAGQVGIAASVVLFILDLRENPAPENIPYEPRRLEVGRARDGGLSVQWNVRF